MSPSSLLSGSPAEVLEKILPGDPLGLSGLLRARLRQQALFLDYDRLLLKVFAEVARKALNCCFEKGLQAWLGRQVDAVLAADLLDERQALGDWAFAVARREVSATFTQLALPLGLEPEDLRASCARFHALDLSIREAFYLLVVEGRSLDHAAQLGALSAPQLARNARRALDVLLGSIHA